jgi:SAM-dependent methyltransferase
MMDVVEHREFYRSALGRQSASALATAIGPLLQPAKDQTVLGLGYATPMLDMLVPDDVTSFSFMLARQGVMAWPIEQPVRSALVEACDLPLLESSVDYAIVMHGLEVADSPLEMLQELWRVLAPQGKLILVVPNRRGLWAAADALPFGQGQPFSRRQLTVLLKDAQFSVQSMRPALFTPPSHGRTILRASRWFEKFGHYTMPRFSGVIVVEAIKQVYAFTPGKRVRRFVPRLRPVLLPAPQGARFSAKPDVHHSTLQNAATLPMKARPN